MVKHKSTDKGSPKANHILHKTIMNSKDKFKKEIARPLSDMLQTCTIEQLEQLIEPSKNLPHQGQFQLAFPKLERLIYPSNEDRGSITPKEFCSSIEKLVSAPPSLVAHMLTVLPKVQFQRIR
jgi:hypothetical protein